MRPTRILAAIASIVTISVVATTAITAEDTRAAWLDAEYVAAPLGTLSCEPGADEFSSRASGKLLSGRALGIDLDALANVRGIDVANTATDVVVDPAPPIADAAGDDAYVNALEVTALSAVNVSLGNLLALPLDTGTGVVNHYAQARDDGTSTGATGAVNDTGGVQLAPVAPGSQRPALATVELGRLLSGVTGQGVSSLITNLADARLEVGAVASRASLDACSAAWTNDLYSSLTREYLVSALRLNVDTPLVAGLVTATKTTINGVEGTVEALAGNSGVVTGLTSGVLNLVGGLLSGLGLGNVSVSDLNVTVNLSAVNALLDDTISDSRGIVNINLATGTVAIDLAGLLGSEFGTTGVNGLPPNTQLLINAGVVTALTTAVTEALTDWVGDITSALSLALDGISLGAKVSVSLLGQNSTSSVATVALTIPQSSLADLLAGNVKAVSKISLLGGDCTDPVLTLVQCLLEGVVNLLVVPLINGIGKLLGDVLRAAIFNTTGTGGVLKVVTTTLTGLLTPLTNFIGPATSGLFGENSVLSLSANAQNLPNPAATSGTALPRWAASLPGPDPVTRTTGRYDVAALRLSTLGLLGPGLAIELDFARSSVGSNTVVR
jgi:hypothetical protein